MICLIFGFYYYMFIGFSVSYDDIAIADAPVAIKDAIYRDPEKLGYRLFHEDTHTYIYYKANHEPNEYITTLLDMKLKGGVLVSTAHVDYATNDGYVSYEKLLKVDRIKEDNLILEESIDVNENRDRY